MSRAGYCEDGIGGEWALICWRGAVKSAIRGRRGQAFLKEMLVALDALPEKRLITEELVHETGVCAMGAVIVMRGTDVSKVDPYDGEHVAHVVGVAPALAREIAWINDKDGPYNGETEEQRFERVRAWVAAQIKAGGDE
jgi:hypothetical protein